jgi:hypothetical protein
MAGSHGAPANNSRVICVATAKLFYQGMRLVTPVLLYTMFQYKLSGITHPTTLDGAVDMRSDGALLKRRGQP